MSEPRYSVPKMCNFTWLSDASGRNWDDCKKAVLAAGIEPCGKVRGNDVYPTVESLRACVRAIEMPDRSHTDRSVGGVKTADDGQKITPKVRKDMLDGDRVLMELQREAGQLTEKMRVVAMVGEVVKVIVTEASSFADRIDAEHGVPPDLLQALDSHMRGFCETVVSVSQRQIQLLDLDPQDDDE